MSKFKPSSEIESPVPCDACNGTGRVDRQTDANTPPANQDQTCPVCGGTGNAPAPTIEASQKNKNCFVATVAFGNPNCRELYLLRNYRDRQLSRHAPGRAFIKSYYRFGPRLAEYVERRPLLRRYVKTLLTLCCSRLEKRHTREGSD